MLGTGIRLPFSRSGRPRPPPQLIVVNSSEDRPVSDARSRSRSPTRVILSSAGTGRQRSRTVQLERGPSPTQLHVPDGLLHPMASGQLDQTTLRTEVLQTSPLPHPFIGPSFSSPAPPTVKPVVGPRGRDSPPDRVQSSAPTPSRRHDGDVLPSRSGPEVFENISTRVLFEDQRVPVSAYAQRIFLDRPAPSEPYRPRNADRTIPQSPRPSLPSLRRANASTSTIVPGHPHSDSVDADRPPLFESRSTTTGGRGRHPPAPSALPAADNAADAESRRIPSRAPWIAPAEERKPPESVRANNYRSRSRSTRKEGRANTAQRTHTRPDRSASQPPPSYALAADDSWF